MTWFWLSGRGQSGLNVSLLVQKVDDLGCRTMRPGFVHSKACQRCGKFDEHEIFQTGFEPERRFKLRKDLYAEVLDLPVQIASERFREVCENAGIGGVQYLPCGISPHVGRLFVLAPEHTTPCSASVADWIRPHPSLQCDSPFAEWCSVCGRAIYTVGLPPLDSLELPSKMTISVPSTLPESRLGVAWLFLCSDTVRDALTSAKLKGCCFSPVSD